MLVEMLLKENHKKKVLVYAIAGTGGIGKTTLAWKIFKDEMIRTSFSQIPPAWVDVPRHYEEVTGQSVLKKIIMDFKGDPGDIQNSHNLPNKLRQLVTGKKFFLVLNDVWTIEVWDGLLKPLLRDAGPGSRILVTTRDRAISRRMDAERCHDVPKLSPEDSWSLLCKVVFRGGDEREKQNLKHVGMRIVDKCDGLPLALTTIGGVLKDRDLIQAEWEKLAGGWSFEEPEDIRGVGKKLMKELYPSYEDLPSQIKQCFFYCAMFPEDYMLRQDVLVPLWIAEGFIKPSKDSSMEDTAEECWKQLVQRSLLQADPGYHDQGGSKMHRVLRSLALYLAQGEYFSGNVQEFARQTPSAGTSSSPKRRRVLMKDAKGVPNLDAIKGSTTLRTIIFLDTPLLQKVPADFLKKFPFLRVLDLSGAPNSKLPDAVQYLIHLRYLNLSRSQIVEIPNAVRRLRNLQFLGLAECRRLRILSDAILELRNLRALDVDGTPLEGMPKKMGKLQRLTRLAGFRVNSNMSNADSGGAEGGEEGQDGRQRGPVSWCTLEELKYLTQLRFLLIQNLERISSIDEAERAELSSKSRLDDLRLTCNPDQHAVVADGERWKIKEVFDKLCPPSRLQRLEVGGYFGLEYPVWMTDGSISSRLPDLKHLELRDCVFCQTLPPLGLLPHLETLHISGAAAVKSIENKFLLGDDAAPGQAQHRFPAFPKLKKLVLKNMDSWKFWLWEKEDPEIILLPLLEELVIERCDKLMSLPEALLHNLTRLTIERASSLGEIGNLPSVRTLKIAGRNLVRIYNLPALENLTIVDCYELSEMKIGELQYLKLEDQTMISLPNWLKNEKEVKKPLQSLASKASKSLFASGQDFVAVRKLEFICSTWLLQRCIEGGPEWPKIQDIPHVKGYTMDKSRYISYDKSNPGLKFDTNIKEEEITRERTTDSSIRIQRTTNNGASPFSIAIPLFLVVGFAKLASDYRSFLLPFLMKAAAAIRKFK